jgi:hypothetical protein
MGDIVEQNISHQQKTHGIGAPYWGPLCRGVTVG